MVRCFSYMKKVLFIHGFNGSPEGRAFHALKEALPSGYSIEAIDYDQSDCTKALKQIRERINSHRIDLVIGCSLGGFLALLSGSGCRFAVNPCYHPSEELTKLGAAASIVESYKRYEDRLDLTEIEDKELVHGFFGDKDELLGTKYFDLFQKQYRYATIIPSTHHLSKKGAQAIFKHIDEYWERVKRLEKYICNVDNLPIYDYI